MSLERPPHCVLLPWAITAALTLTLAACYEVKQLPAYAPKTHAIELNRQALESLEAGALEVALERASAAVQEDPDFDAAYLNKANILGKLQRFAEAAQTLRALLQRRPDNAQARVLLGLLIERGGDALAAAPHYEQAVRLLEEYLAEQDKDVEAAVNRAVAVYLSQGKAQGFIAINKVLAKFPGYAPAQTVKKRMRDKSRDDFVRVVFEPDTPG